MITKGGAEEDAPTSKSGGHSPVPTASAKNLSSPREELRKMSLSEEVALSNLQRKSLEQISHSALNTPSEQPDGNTLRDDPGGSLQGTMSLDDRMK